MIFTPIDWGVWFNPEDAWCSDDPAVCEAGGTAIIDQVDILEAAIDGVPVANPKQYRAASGAFTLDIAAGTWPTELGYPAGLRYPTVAEGHWLMLAPLSVGEHTIHLVWGSSLWGGVAADTTYHITVTAPRRTPSPKEFQVQD